MSGLIAFRSGNQLWSQRFQRMRVIFQMGTVLAMVAGGAMAYKK